MPVKKTYVLEFTEETYFQNGKVKGIKVSKFKGDTKQDAIDEFIMWLSQESFDWRLPPEVAQSLLDIHDDFRLSNREWGLRLNLLEK